MRIFLAGAFRMVLSLPPVFSRIIRVLGDFGFELFRLSPPGNSALLSCCLPIRAESPLLLFPGSFPESIPVSGRVSDGVVAELELPVNLFSPDSVFFDDSSSFLTGESCFSKDILRLFLLP